MRYVLFAPRAEPKFAYLVEENGKLLWGARLSAVSFSKDKAVYLKDMMGFPVKIIEAKEGG